MSAYPSIVGRTVIVTGGSRGLGRAMALGLVRAGARVAIVGRGPSPQLNETLRQAASITADPQVVTALGDLRKPSDCERILSEVLAAFGKVEVLVNNAGIPNIGPGAPFWSIGVDEWLRISHTNIDALFLITRCVVPSMIAQGFGKIINISTNDFMMVRKHMSPYGPSKAFVEACSRIWAQDLSGTGVTVNVLLPGGPVDTAADVTGVVTEGPTFVPASAIVAPLLWLVSDESNAHSSERFMATLWKEGMPLKARTMEMRQIGFDLPRIVGKAGCGNQVS
jgi:NAD(P)-dependent dehydrogenase (short-subunit alcohol dehydrogenase family)